MTTELKALAFLSFFVAGTRPVFPFLKDVSLCARQQLHLAVHRSLVWCANGFFWLFHRSVSFLSRLLVQPPGLRGAVPRRGLVSALTKWFACACVCVCVQELTIAEEHTLSSRSLFTTPHVTRVHSCSLKFSSDHDRRDCARSRCCGAPSVSAVNGICDWARLAAADASRVGRRWAVSSLNSIRSMFLVGVPR